MFAGNCHPERDELEAETITQERGISFFEPSANLGFCKDSFYKSPLPKSKRITAPTWRFLDADNILRIVCLLLGMTRIVPVYG